MINLYTSIENIGNFIDNSKDNRRNCIYITCSVCKHNRLPCCEDILVNFNENGNPAFMMVSDANHIFSTIIDKSECICEMSNAKFRCLFENYINEYTNAEKGCPFLQLAKMSSSGL